MRRAGIATSFAAVMLLSASVHAQPIPPDVPDCGGDAFSSAEVIEHRPPRRGPVTAVPDTLCADLAPQRPPTPIDIYTDPILLPENGGRPPGAPYDGWPRRGGPPRP